MADKHLPTDVCERQPLEDHLLYPVDTVRVQQHSQREKDNVSQDGQDNGLPLDYLQPPVDDQNDSPPVPPVKDCGQREEPGSSRRYEGPDTCSSSKEGEREERDTNYDQHHAVGGDQGGPRMLDNHQKTDYDYFVKDTDQVPATEHGTKSQWAIKRITSYDYDVLAYQCTDHAHHGAWVIGTI